MNTNGPNFWPFPILAEEQLTKEHRKEVRFLDAAYQAGFHPCKFFEREYQAHVEDGRYGWIICRGRTREGGPKRWEVWLDEQSGRVAAYWVDDFDAATASVLKWLAGGDAHDIVEAAKPHIIRGPQVNVAARG